MNAYERIITQMKSAVGNTEIGMQIGTMAASGKCKAGDLTLDKDDYLIAEHLKGGLHSGDEVLLYQVGEEWFVIICKVVSP